MKEPQTPCTCITAHDRAVCIGWCQTRHEYSLVAGLQPMTTNSEDKAKRERVRRLAEQIFVALIGRDSKTDTKELIAQAAGLAEDFEEEWDKRENGE